MARWGRILVPRSSGVVTLMGGIGLLAITFALRRFAGDFWSAVICISAVFIELKYPFVGRYATVLLGASGLFAITFTLRLYAGNFVAAVLCAFAMALDYYCE
jgi:hypothetical protein